MGKSVELSVLVGKTIEFIEADVGSDEIIIRCTDGSTYKMHHWQDCCEYVYIDDIDGDIQRLVGQKVIVAEMRSEDDEKNETGEWTFYVLRTNLDFVTIRWYGSSDSGYYAVGVSFEQI